MEIVTSWERQGRQKGLQEGRQEGLQEGLQEGRQQAQEEIAINLLREGLAVELVVKTTGLTVERLQELQAQLQQEAREV